MDRISKLFACSLMLEYSQNNFDSSTKSFFRFVSS